MPINPGQLYGIHREIGSFLQKIDILKDEFKTLSDKCANAKMLREQEEKLVLSLKTEKAKLDKLIASQHQSIDLNNVRWSKIRDEIDALNIKKQTLFAKHKELSDSIKGAELYKPVIEVSLSGLIETRNKVSEELYKTHNQITQAKGDLDKLLSVHKVTISELSKLDHDIEIAKQEYQKIVKENEQYRITLDEYRTNLNNHAVALNKYYKDLNKREGLNLEIKLYGENT